MRLVCAVKYSTHVQTHITVTEKAEWCPGLGHAWSGGDNRNLPLCFGVSGSEAQNSGSQEGGPGGLSGGRRKTAAFLGSLALRVSAGLLQEKQEIEQLGWKEAWDFLSV